MTIPDPHTLDRIIAWLEPWGPDTPHHEAAQALKALRTENERLAAIVTIYKRQPTTLSINLETGASQEAIDHIRTEMDRMRADYAAKCHNAAPAAQAHPAAWQPMDSAPHDATIIAWWPIVALDENGDPTETVEDGHAFVTEWNGGYWLEPDVLNAMGDHMGDDSTYADSPSHWLRLPAAPLAEIAAKEGEAADARAFDAADYYWRTMDPDDAGDTPEEAIRHVGDLCVCEIASSFNGPTRYGFTSPTLDPDDDETEFLHFATEEEAIAAATERRKKLAEIEETRAKGEEDND